MVIGQEEHSRDGIFIDAAQYKSFLSLNIP